MLAPRIIACLDIADGRVVKGTKFVDLKDQGDPVELAKIYENQGVDELVFLDITATVDQRQTLYDLCSDLANELSIPFCVGGGIRSVEDMNLALLSGADKVGINSAAVSNPSLITECAQRFGSQAVVVAIDAKITTQGYMVATHGGRKATDLDAIEWAKKAQELGAGELLVTAIDRDGTGIGFDLELYEMLVNTVTIPVIASGGAKQASHFADAFTAGCTGALAAGIFHRNELTILDIKQELAENGMTIRI